MNICDHQTLGNIWSPGSLATDSSDSSGKQEVGLASEASDDARGALRRAWRIAALVM